jgi:hypothetical protein
MPLWLTIIIQLLNLLGSSAMVGMATYGQMPPGKEAAYAGVVAGVGAAVQQLRNNPFSKQEIQKKVEG